jgi:hypothetical protein
VSPELESRLFDAYPELYRARLGAENVAIKTLGIECGDGWFHLLADLSEELVESAIRAGRRTSQSDWPAIVQVKQKFGGLRVYLGLPDDRYTPILESYRLKSHKTCEECGQPGETGRSSHGVITACSNHRTTHKKTKGNIRPIWMEFANTSASNPVLLERSHPMINAMTEGRKEIMAQEIIFDRVSVHPWIGSNYSHPIFLRHRTLILGESNYTEPHLFGKNLVLNCVLDDIDTESKDRDTTGFCKFATKIRRVIFGRNTSITPGDFWNDVAYYNFIQYLVGGKSRERPTQQMWTDSIPAFEAVVSAIEPERILVLGKGNWTNLLGQLVHRPINETTSALEIGGRTILSGYIFHPSSGRGFSYAKWQPVAMQLLKPKDIEQVNS